MMRFPRSIISVSPFRISVLAVLLFLALYIANLDIFNFIELKAYDLRMVSRGVTQPGGEVAIAAIDEKSLNEIGRWPWPRSVMAELVSTLKGYGARAVGFDVVFAEPERNSGLGEIEGIAKELRTMGFSDARLYRVLAERAKRADTDAVFAAALKKAENATLGYFFYMSEKEGRHLADPEKDAARQGIAGSRYGVVKVKGKPDEGAFIKAYSAAANVPALSGSSENCGFFNAFPDRDGVIRKAPLVVARGEDFYMPLSLAAGLQYMDWPELILTISDLGVESLRLGRTVIPTDESGRMLVNFGGPPKTFPHYSISDILKGNTDPELFRDRIVLVGATATGIYDMRATPFGTVYPGIEIHAAVIDNILRGSFIRRPAWTGLFDFSAIIIMGLAMGALVPRVRAIQGVALGALIVFVYISVNYLIFASYNLWLNLVYPVLTAAAAYVGITIFKYVTEEREKKKIRGAFQYYLTSSVINEMLKDPSKLKLGGDKKDLTVMFSDIRGFTTISESLTPEELVHLLNEYLTAMTNIVFKYDGLLDKYIGDAIMAVFGAPLDQPDHAEKACRTALEMNAELIGLQKKWEGEGRPAIRIGIGVNTGEMVVGNMGSEMRFDYTVMGDSVNLASRLEGINKEYGTSIVISETTYGRVSGNFVCRELDSVRVKGKLVPVKIYELLGEAADAGKWAGFLAVFGRGLDLYKRGLWDEAAVAFREALQARPGDSVSALYISRCNELKSNPPAAWDGVFTMTKK